MKTILQKRKMKNIKQFSKSYKSTGKRLIELTIWYYNRSVQRKQDRDKKVKQTRWVHNIAGFSLQSQFAQPYDLESANPKKQSTTASVLPQLVRHSTNHSFPRQIYQPLCKYLLPIFELLSMQQYVSWEA